MDIEQDITSPNLSYNLVQQLVNQSKVGVAQFRINQEQNENQFTFAIGYSSNQQYGCNPIYSNGLNIKLGTDQKTLYVNTGIPDSNGTIKNKNVLFDSTNNYYMSNAIFYPQNIYSNQQSNSLSYQTQIISQYLNQITSGFLFNSNIIFDTLNQQYIKANFGSLTYIGNVERGIQFTSNGILQSSSNIIWDYSKNYLGINTATPQQQIDVKGNIQTNQQSIAQQIVSTLSSNDSSNQAIILQNSNMISNLNTQYFQGLTPDYFRNVNNVNNGILPVVFGGTGQNYISNGQLIFGQGVTTQTTSNLYWDNPNNRLGINTSNPQYTVDVAGNVNVQSLVQTIGLNVTQSGIIRSNLVINSNLTVNGTETANDIQVVNTITSLSNLSSNSTVNSNLIVGNNLIVSNQITSLSNLVSNETIKSNLTVNNQLISTISTGISPFNVISTTLVYNLNVQYLNGQPQSYYTNASNISSGTLNVFYGGTGINIVSNGFLFYASNNVFAQNSNLYYNDVSNYLGINNSNPAYPLDVIGNTYIKGNLIVNGQIYIIGNSASTTQSGGTGSTTSNTTTTGATNASNINGILQVTNGGTGLSNILQGYILFGQDSNQLGQSSNLFWDSTSLKLGIKTFTPQYEIDVIGSIQCSYNLITSNQVVSLISTGTAPIQVSSTTLVSNMNVEYLNGQLGSYYTNASNIVSGILNTVYGGTGLSSFQSGCILYASGVNTLAQTSNLVYNSSNSNVQVSQLNITTSNQSPLVISNSNLVSNLNVQYLNGQLGSYYTNASNIVSGILNTVYGGTGLSSFQSGFILYASSSNTLAQTSNLIYNSASSNVQVSQLNITTTSQSPLVISNSNLVSNLNVQYLNGQLSSYYTNATNISSGILSVTYGGTGLSSLSQGFIPFGQGAQPGGSPDRSSSLGSSLNLFWDSTNFRLGIGNTNPQQAIDVTGNINCSSNIISSNQFVSAVAVGTAPFTVASTTLVTNLNVQYLSGQSGSYYTNASNINSGILSTVYGGTGLSGFQPGLILYASGVNSLTQTSNLVYDSTNSNIKINQLNVTTTSQAPFIVSNSNLVSNLNVQYLNGQLGSYYTNASNISTGILSISYGGTGLTTLTQGYIPFGQGSNAIGSTCNLFWNNSVNYLGIGTATPSNAVDVVGTIRASSNIISSNQFVSTVAVGTAPFNVTSTTLVSNLNVQYLNGQPASYYTNTFSGTVPVSQGGTGLTTLAQGYIPFGSGSSPFGYSSNLFWNSTSNYLGINNINPSNPLDVIGNTYIKGNLTVSGYINVIGAGSSTGTGTSTSTSSVLPITSGGTGLSNVTQGYIPFGQESNQLGQSSNFFWDSTNLRLGIRNSTPQHAVDVIGSINGSSNIYYSNQLFSFIATGTAPFSVTSTTLVSNLNVQLLNGCNGAYYTNASSINQGVLSTSYGGTGLSSFQAGLILYSSSSNTLAQTSNLAYDQTNSNIKINQLNITTTSQSPLIISNSNLISNLNAQYLNGYNAAFYTNANCINSGILSTSYGGTGLSSFQAGLILYSSSSNTIAQTSNLAYDSVNSNIKINQLNITTTSQASLIISNSNLVSNLNAQYLNGYNASFYTNANCINAGVLGVPYGGTGLSQITSGYVPIGNGTSSLTLSSNLFFDVNSNNLGVGTTTPINDIQVQSGTAPTGAGPTSSIHPIIGLVNTTWSSFLQMSSSQTIPQISSSSNGLSLGYTPTFTSNQSNYVEVCRVDQKGLTTNNITLTSIPNFANLQQYVYQSNQTAASSVQLFNSKASIGSLGSSFTFTSASNTVTANYTGYIQFNSQIYANYNPNVLTTPTYLLSILKNSNAIYQISTSSGYSPLPIQLVTSCSSNDVFQIAFTVTNGTVAVLSGSVIGVSRLY